MSLPAPSIQTRCPSVNNTTSTTKNCCRSVVVPKSSLSFSTKTTKIDPHNSIHNQIKKLCKASDLAETLGLLQELDLGKRYGAMSMILQACGRQKDIEIGRKVHEMAWNSAYYKNDSVLNTRIITMYSMCASPTDSRYVFDQLERKNLFHWNAIVSAYTRNELWQDAILMFCELMLVTDHKPDNFTFPCVIKACIGVWNLSSGQAVHGMAVKMGLISDVFVNNVLILMYTKFELTDDAVKVFDCMSERNLVSWNSMISGFSDNGFSQECFCLLNEMLECEEGLIPDEATLVTVLPVCAGEQNFIIGRIVHGLATKLGLSNELMVNNALIDMYLKCNLLLDAQILFDKNITKSEVTWNSIIGCYSREEGLVSHTFDLVRKMQAENKNTKPSHVTILNVLPVCLEQSELSKVKELHGYSFRHEFQNYELLGNAFISAYAKCGSLESAKHVFHSMENNKTLSSWNAFIGGCAQNGDPLAAIDLYFNMLESGLEPNLFTIGTLLLACSKLKFLHYGKEIHSFVLRNSCQKDSFIGISILSLYISCGKLLSARALFDQMKDKNLVSWNTMITGYWQNGLPNETLGLFRKMVFDRNQPYEIALTSVLAVCSQLSALCLGKEVHCFALKASLANDSFVACSIIDMYAKSGSIEQSQRVFNTLKKVYVASWSVLITGYGIHGRGKEALQLFDEMRRAGFKPDEFTFVGILMACNHAGLVQEGLMLFTEMHQVHHVEPKLEHYACVIDMLGRAGRIADALELVAEMPEKPDAGIWSSLLSSCRIHGEFDLGRVIANKLLELEPNKSENYVLVSNLFARFSKWDDVRTVRSRMKARGLHKDVGCSWTEVKGKIYNFIVGDKMHQESREMWRSLEEKIIKIGYVPDTSSVLRELKEEEKLEILRGHSEKLAISFGLLQTKEGSTLRICKNLRICSDCHNAIKLVSKVVEREIIVRDNKRFHHFKDGICSCKDFW